MLNVKDFQIDLVFPKKWNSFIVDFWSICLNRDCTFLFFSFYLAKFLVPTMDAQKLKAIQTPIKAKYKEQPSSAILTLSAEGDLGSEGVYCSVKTGKKVLNII